MLWPHNNLRETSPVRVSILQTSATRVQLGMQGVLHRFTGLEPDALLHLKHCKLQQGTILNSSKDIIARQHQSGSHMIYPEPLQLCEGGNASDSSVESSLSLLDT